MQGREESRGMLSGVSTTVIRSTYPPLDGLLNVSTTELLPIVSVAGIIDEAFRGFLADVASALPKLLSGVVFLSLSYVAIRFIMVVVRTVLQRSFRGQPIYVQLGSTIVKVFLWFGVLLSFLSAVGLGPIAASLGTASGFLALGVAYALSDMIEDVVAGVYLLRDPDFNVGDTVTAADTTGTIEAIELRKTRFSVGDDTVVRANAAVEAKWTLLSNEPQSEVVESA